MENSKKQDINLMENSGQTKKRNLHMSTRKMVGHHKKFRPPSSPHCLLHSSSSVSDTTAIATTSTTGRFRNPMDNVSSFQDDNVKLQKCDKSKSLEKHMDGENYNEKNDWNEYYSRNQYALTLPDEYDEKDREIQYAIADEYNENDLVLHHINILFFFSKWMEVIFRFIGYNLQE
jgi:hypothetical protein